MPSTERMARLAQRVETELGLHFAALRQRDLDQAVGRMARAGGFADQDALLDWLLGGAWDRPKADLCARHLTIAETYFFREPRAFTLLCEVARAKLATNPQASLRVWSAGCCTGEEPYSMAIALRQALPGLDPGRMAILGTDLNAASLATARAGLYRDWSFRRSDPALRAAWFSAAGPGLYALRPDVRAQVRFAQLNLAQPLFPSAAGGIAGMDVIFCRNVLMYFSRRQMQMTIARLRACLVEGGWLVVNPSEASSELFAGFAATYHPDAIFYRKLPDRAPVRAPAGARAAIAPAPAPARVLPLPDAPVAAPAPLAAAPDPGAVIARARELARAGEPAAAFDALLDGAGRWPLEAGIHLAAAEIALEQGEASSALVHLQRHLYLEPDSILAHYLSAIAHLGEGSRERALREFAASDALLDRLADDAVVPGADGWQAASLRASVRAWKGRVG
ncbi:CheR family methyltransferase [Massilia niastensis]|uniref:CheR family methyltransferase n=1 Tax=Massilia niastensis TaxID=544911 RepID=UPI0003A823AC|nr:protein-glutamate O-methyltransferase CheR [Massilia niastensis]